MRGQRFQIPEKRLMRTEFIFWRYLNQSGKRASTIGSNTCKGGEYFEKQ